jgi:hypothetical protein
MLNRFLRRIIASLIAAGLAGGAAAVSVIAGGFALYAGLRHWLSAPMASAATALGFALIAGLIVSVAPNLWKRRGGKGQRSYKVDSETVRTTAETAMAVMTAVMAARAGRPAKARDQVASKTKRPRK